MENLVNQLTNTHDKGAQVNFLQEIGKKLLTEYVIKTGDVTIKPLTIYAAAFTSITQFAKLFCHFILEWPPFVL